MTVLRWQEYATISFHHGHGGGGGGGRRNHQYDHEKRIKTQVKYKDSPKDKGSRVKISLGWFMVAQPQGRGKTRLWEILHEDVRRKIRKMNREYIF